MRSSFTKVLARSAAKPLNLGVLAAGVLGAIAVASGPIGALAGVAYFALVASDVSNLEFRRKVLLGRTPPKALPKPETIANVEIREAVAAIVAAREELERTIRAIPERVRRNVATSLRAIDELATHGAALAARGDELSRFLAASQLDEGEADRLATRAREATDPGARDDYAHAARAAAERIAAVTDIRAARERILANLARIAATMRGVPSKLVRLRALDDQASDALTGDVGAELERMNIDLRAFEDTLAAIAEVQA